MYSKSKYFSLNPLGGFNEGMLNNMEIDKDKGLVASNISGKNAIFYPVAFDSRECGTNWHKIQIRFSDFPEGASCEASYFASDSKKFMEIDDLDLYMLDRSVNDENKNIRLEKLWETCELYKLHMTDIQDGLIKDAVGRYLWIKIRIWGAEKCKKKAVIQKIRIYYPRMSYLSYLPAVYQEDTVSRDFLERFLSVFSTLIDGMEEKIDNIAQYFDRDFVNNDYLKWLSSWLDIRADDRWDDEKLRKLLKKAPEIYKIRGTRRAIEEMIEIYTDEKPRIIEYFEFKGQLSDPQKAKDLSKLYGTRLDPYTFIVIVKPGQIKENYQKMAIQKILEEEKPAFTQAILIVLRDNIELNNHTYLGENSMIPKESKFVLDPGKLILYKNRLGDSQKNEGSSIDDEVRVEE